MQREETILTIGPHRIRLVQRPPQVPPSYLTCDKAQQESTSELGPHIQRDGNCRADLLPPQEAPGSLELSDCILGWELWPAALALAAYLTSAPGVKLMQRARAVVELGAGLGLPSIVAARVGATSVTLTDLPQALPLLKANVELNEVAGVCHTAVLDWSKVAAAHCSSAAGGTCVSAAGGSYAPGAGLQCCTAAGRVRGQDPKTYPTMKEDSPGALVHTGRYDVVLAADIVCVSSLVPLLADTIATICSNNGAVALVAHTVRKSLWLDRDTGEVRIDDTDEPWEAFMLRMTKLHGFSCEYVLDSTSLTAAGDFVVPPDTSVCVFTRPSAESHSAA